ncbi:MAG: PaaI family thioesterase [Acidimicrobiia bacterium]|nr:PaaI family thioesterase [Acidimicrobiia bacterium]MDH3462382.1 PaaI family thioesterase [Acidimicrobiia bacterium]
MDEFTGTEEPYRGAIGDMRLFQNPGFESLRRVAFGEYPGAAAFASVRFPVTDVGLGKVSFPMPVTKWLEDAFGLVEAGVFALFADGPLASALWTGLPAGKVSTTSEINMSFVRPATGKTTSRDGADESDHPADQCRQRSHGCRLLSSWVATVSKPGRSHRVARLVVLAGVVFIGLIVAGNAIYSANN